MRESPSKALRLQYKKILEVGLIVSLILHIVLLQVFKKIEMQSNIKEVELKVLEVEDIPQTEQQKEAAAPSRPTVPIASEDEELLDDEIIDFSKGFTNLHTKVYEEILKGNGFGIEDARPAITLAYNTRNAEVQRIQEHYHPYTNQYI